MKLKFAITPCPNDVFSYYKLLARDTDIFDFIFDDIETLNKAAADKRYTITKLSFASYIANADKYELLDAGAALGIGTGPVFVAREDWNGQGAVAVPGMGTTAALLYKFYAGKDAEIFPMLFSDILPAFERGEISAGVLIHEGRFVFKDYGLKLVCDLGDYWTSKTGLPIPLGCICIRKDFAHMKAKIENEIRKSIRYAFANFDETIPLVKKYAQHLDDTVLRDHITAFVNEYSYDISQIRESLLTNLQ